MLVNLSNHPFAQWGQAQRDAALLTFGHVVDVAFPNVPPEATASAVAALVSQTAAAVGEVFADQAERLSASPGEDTTHDGVHLMGETSFVVEFSLQWLTGEVKEPLYCSTTAREVEVLPDGAKRSRFRFVQFRPMAGR